MPSFEIKEWNENNFNVDESLYTRSAYDEGKYAFVSDYVRFFALYHEGGVYLDVDVELIASVEDILEGGPFLAWERESARGESYVNPGLGCAMDQGNEFCLRVLQALERTPFLLERKKINPLTMVPIVTDLLIDRGVIANGERQNVDGIEIYPADFFCPKSSLTGKEHITPNTKSIHHFNMSWMGLGSRCKTRTMRLIRSCLNVLNGLAEKS